MSNIWKGLLAGLVATAVLSVLMMMKQAMGLMPELDPIGMIGAMSGMSSPAIGWTMHVLIGTVMWGGLFSLVESHLPGSHVVRGIVFGVAAWLLMMVVVMPMAGAGVFGLTIGMAAPVITLMLHIVFGATLGAVYGALVRTTRVSVI